MSGAPLLLAVSLGADRVRPSRRPGPRAAGCDAHRRAVQGLVFLVATVRSVGTQFHVTNESTQTWQDITFAIVGSDGSEVPPPHRRDPCGPECHRRSITLHRGAGPSVRAAPGDAAHVHHHRRNRRRRPYRRLRRAVVAASWPTILSRLDVRTCWPRRRSGRYGEPPSPSTR